MAKPDYAETEAEAAEMVVAAGYTNPANMEQHGHTWHCTGVNSTGQTVSLVVDGAGKVHAQEVVDEPHPEPH